MRTSFLAWPIAALATVIFVGCGLEQLSQGGGSGSSAATKGDAGSDADAGIQGAGCGIESGSGQQLCIATSICPTVIVDTSSLPHCGFRIKGSTSELVCACGEPLAPHALPRGLHELGVPVAHRAERSTPGRGSIPKEPDLGYGASHGYDVTHGGPSGPGDAPADVPDAKT